MTAPTREELRKAWRCLRAALDIADALARQLENARQIGEDNFQRSQVLERENADLRAKLSLARTLVDPDIDEKIAIRQQHDCGKDMRRQPPAPKCPYCDMEYDPALAKPYHCYHEAKSRDPQAAELAEMDRPSRVLTNEEAAPILRRYGIEQPPAPERESVDAVPLSAWRREMSKLILRIVQHVDSPALGRIDLRDINLRPIMGDDPALSPKETK